MTATRQPRYRVCVYELRDGNTTQVINAYGTGFTTAVATSKATTWKSTSAKADPATSSDTSPPQPPTNTPPAADANSIRHDLLSPHLSERELRLWAAVEALSYARGGVAAVSRATGIAPAQIRRAQRELSAGESAGGAGATERLA